MHRIPNGRNFGGNSLFEENIQTKPVIFLQHGLLASSADWVS